MRARLPLARHSWTGHEGLLALADEQQREGERHRFFYSALVLQLLGQADRARQRCEEAVALARETGHVFSLAFALLYAARLHQIRRDVEGVRERAEAAITLATEHGFAQWRANGRILQGWARAAQGMDDEGLALMYEGRAAIRATGAELLQAYWLFLLAEVEGNRGRPQDGVPLLDEALARVERTGERWWQVELHRLRGELRRATGRTPEATAEADLEHALEVARVQGARWLELRAAMSLSRLWQARGRTQEARQLLGDIYNRFTEGFDTRDLQDARARLAALS